MDEKIFTKTKSKSRLDDCTSTFLQEKESSTDTTCNTSINTKYFAEIISAIITYLSTEKIGKLPPERFQFSSNKGAFEAQQLYFLSLSWWPRRGYPLTERLQVSIHHLYKFVSNDRSKYDDFGQPVSMQLIHQIKRQFKQIINWNSWTWTGHKKFWVRSFEFVYLWILLWAFCDVSVLNPKLVTVKTNKSFSHSQMNIIFTTLFISQWFPLIAILQWHLQRNFWWQNLFYSQYLGQKSR